MLFEALGTLPGKPYNFRKSVEESYKKRGEVKRIEVCRKSSKSAVN
jgi:hypothetical protein